MTTVSPTVGGVSPTTTSMTGTTPPSTSSSTQQLAGTDMFLQLLVAQMQNQDPTQPMDDSTFVTQLAQFNTVEQMITLNQTISAQTGSQQTAEAVSMIGKTITYQIPGVGSAPPTVGQDVVTGVTMQGGQVSLQGQTSTVPLSEVTAVTG